MSKTLKRKTQNPCTNPPKDVTPHNCALCQTFTTPLSTVYGCPLCRRCKSLFFREAGINFCNPKVKEQFTSLGLVDKHQESKIAKKSAPLKQVSSHKKCAVHGCDNNATVRGYGSNELCRPCRDRFCRLHKVEGLSCTCRNRSRCNACVLSNMVKSGLKAPNSMRAIQRGANSKAVTSSEDSSEKIFSITLHEEIDQTVGSDDQSFVYVIEEHSMSDEPSIVCMDLTDVAESENQVAYLGDHCYTSPLR